LGFPSFLLSARWSPLLFIDESFVSHKLQTTKVRFIFYFITKKAVLSTTQEVNRKRKRGTVEAHKGDLQAGFWQRYRFPDSKLQNSLPPPGRARVI
jgi:hypothetical protein